MKFKLFYGISVFNVFLIILIALYGIVTELVRIDETYLDVIKYVILGLAIGTVVTWSCLSYFVNCPHCGEQALLFNTDHSKKPNVEKAIPTILRPFSFMIDEEYFAGYCYCASCHEEIAFDKELVDSFDKHS